MTDFISRTSGMPSHTSGTFLHVLDRFDFVPPCLSDTYGDLLYQVSLIGGMHCIDVSDELIICNDFQCSKHHIEINNLLNDIRYAITIASDFSLPKCSEVNDKKGDIPGWNDFVRPFTDQSIILNNLWKDNGCLIGDEFDRERKLAKIQYHRAIKYVKANRDEIIKSKISSRLCQKNFGEFWKEIRK